MLMASLIFCHHWPALFWAASQKAELILQIF